MWCRCCLQGLNDCRNLTSELHKATADQAKLRNQIGRMAKRAKDKGERQVRHLLHVGGFEEQLPDDSTENTARFFYNVYIRVMLLGHPRSKAMNKELSSRKLISWITLLSQLYMLGSNKLPVVFAMLCMSTNRC